ncbi:MAG: hypothetical protein KGH97_01095, partial [Patescibacteria group bacterium]|nr:hypothetical protein [Patescibacteria group bacterium]
FEGYGVNEEGVEKLAARGATVLITIDSGITDVAAVARARELGMDVILTDHHLPGETLPEAYALVDPKARADEPYPFKELCGAGLAWKLCVATLAVDPALRARVPEGSEKWLLDLAGLATIADMVPLTGENRVIATYGLIVMRKSPRLGFSRLCRAARVDQRRITEDDVAFMIAPRVNAASRMGDAYDALKLFTTRDEREAEELAKRLEAANRARKGQAGAITRAAHARLAERALRSVIAMGDPEWRPALLGLVAGNLAEEYGRPVFLWGREGGQTIKGSVRSGPVHALELMSAAEGAFAEFGGHAASGGFTVSPEAVFDLEDRLVAAMERLADAPVADAGAARADAELAPREVTLEALAQLARFAPFGMGNEKPLFRIREAEILRVSRFGKNAEHLKIAIARGECERPLEAVAFFAKGAVVERAEALAAGGRANLLAHLERDTFTRGQPVRLRLVGLEAV